MLGIDAKLSNLKPDQPNEYQRFSLKAQPEHVLLSFKDDETEFGYLRPNLTKVLEKLMKDDSALDLEAVSRTLVLRETIARAKKPGDALVKVDINIYGPAASAGKVGQALSQQKWWLQRPGHHRRGMAYQNPHYLTFPDMEEIQAEAQREVGKKAGPGGRPDRGQQIRHLTTALYGRLRGDRDLSRVQGSRRVRRQLLE
jgi:SWI/SNF-related matrix-associated actin-dependent regulator of chromatin subfamily A3